MRALVPLFLVAICAGRAQAQPRADIAQPNKIAVGTVYTGAIVEASFLIFEPGKDDKIPLVVNAPPFVKVLSEKKHLQNFGAGNDFVCGTVAFAIDTSVAGELKGEVVATLGTSIGRLPVSASVKRAVPGMHRVLIVETAFDRYTTEDGGAFKPWTDLAKNAQFDVSYLALMPGQPVLRDLDLKKFGCILLAATGLTELKEADLARVRAYAEGGGRVVVAANSFFQGTVPKANTVLDGYGIQMRNEEAPGINRQGVRLNPDDLSAEMIAAGVKSLQFHRASPVTVTDAKLGRVVVRAAGVGKPGDGFVAHGKAGNGDVFALGVSLWWNWIGEEASDGTDNDKLLKWLLGPGK